MRFCIQLKGLNMKTAYTAGEWSVNDWPQSGADICIGAVGTPLIARIPLRDVSINEQRANARLIASAPAMLDALQKLADLCEHVPVFQLDDGKVSVKAVRRAGKFTGAMADARAAIARAKAGA